MPSDDPISPRHRSHAEFRGARAGSRTSRPGREALVLLLFLLALPGSAWGQEALEEARRLRDAGSYAAAADTVQAYLQTRPEDAGAHWMLGQLLYWTGRNPAARDAYEAARSRGLEDPWLELEYAEVLVAVGAWDRAVPVYRDVAQQGPPEARLRALTGLGDLAYWTGDLPLAIRRYREVLEVDPGHEAAGRGLGEVRDLTRPWVRGGAELLDDNQPFRRTGVTVEGGAFLSPLWSLGGEAVLRVTDANGTATGGAARAELRGFLPGPRLEVEAGAGGTWAEGSVRGGSTWIGRARVAVRLPAGLDLEGTAHRERYLWTRTSADTLLMMETLEAAVDRSESPGWAGRVAIRRDGFPDDNEVRTAYGWLLAPAGPWLRLGYAFSWSDAEASTWSEAPEGGPGGPPGGLPGGPGGPPDTGGESTVDGRYDLYFTPEETRIHTLLTEISAEVGSGTARLSGGWGISAREEAPDLMATATGPPVLSFSPREYTPWNLSLSWAGSVSTGSTLELRWEHRETAFYSLTRLEASMAHRFSRDR